MSENPKIKNKKNKGQLSKQGTSHRFTKRSLAMNVRVCETEDRERS